MPWRILRQLGAGASGDVHLAETPQGDTVALKLLSERSHDVIPSFEREATILSRLRHPAIVAILGYLASSEEIFGEDRGPCYWMEYVEGRRILEAARGEDPAAVLDWFRQAVEGLRYLHSEGILHGDISPKNLLIDAAGRLRLIDFGLATLRDSRASLEGATLPYLAPERIAGGHLPASDLFSLGTVFYQALSGAHPRSECRSLDEIVRARPRSLLAAVPILEKKHSLPSRIIDRMIEAEVSRRFASATEILATLRGDETGAADQAVEDYYPSRFLGADDHFKAVHGALEEISRQSAIFALHGITGVGKRRFLREIGFRCALAGIPVREVPPSRLRDGVQDLRDFSSSSPSVFLFGDLDSLTAAELAPLAVLRHSCLPAAGVIVLLHWDDDLLRPESRRFFSTLSPFLQAREIYLGNLGLDDTRRFLEGALGDDPAADLASPLFDATNGNPRLLSELTRSMLQEGIREKRHFSTDWISSLQKHPSIEEILIHRIRNLGEREKEVLLFLAASRYPVDTANLEKAIGTDRITEDLRGPIALHLVSREGTLYRLSLPSLERPLLETLSEEGRISLHERWRDVLADRPADDRRRLHHALALREESVVVEGARVVAERLQKSGMVADALVIAEEAASSLKDPAERSRLLRLQINLLNEMGRFEEALKICEKWRFLRAPDEPTGLREVKYWLITGLAHQNLGREEEAEARLKRCLTAGKGQKDSAALPYLVRAYSLLGASALKRGELAVAKCYLEEGLKLAGAKGRRRAEICRNLAQVSYDERDWTATKRLLDEAKRLYRQENFYAGIFSTFLQEGNLSLSQDDPDAARKAYDEAERIAQERNDDLSLALVWHNRGVLARKRGDLADALERLERAGEIFRLLGSENDLAENLKHLAITEASVGHFERALTCADDEVQRRVKELRDGIRPDRPCEAPSSDRLPNYWDRETALRGLIYEGTRRDAIRTILREIYERLPQSLQVSFMNRSDYQRWAEPKEDATMNTSLILKDLNALNEALLQEDNMGRLLRRLMDSAMHLARAENGFLLLKSGSVNGPFPGFEVVVARNMSKKALATDEYALSLSAVRRALDAREPIVTDNALQDPRFQEAKSVRLHGLKSILALPVVGTEGTLGVFYLDHPLETGLFGEETLEVMRTFAGIAALALQKERMINRLKETNKGLADEVEAKADRVDKLEREVARSKLILKNEYSEIVGRSPKMIRMLSLADKITEAKIAVWIYGESGTGKEAIARALHFNSSRAKRPFVTENCGALPETLLESELFGHKKGAFTHAVADKKGILEYADGGTVFLDEIADMSANLQSKLLRFLQEGELRPLGSHQTVRVDVRIVSASNRDLQDLVSQGKFREDLFFRLNGVSITLPPLRDRVEDLPLLVGHFLKKIGERDKKGPFRLHPDTLKIFMSYRWPGNIRELQNTLETAVLFAEKGVVLPSSLEFKPALVRGSDIRKTRGTTEMKEGPVPPELEKILLAIRDQGFHRSNAARALGISRRKLYSTLEKFGVPRELNAIKEMIDRHFN